MEGKLRQLMKHEGINSTRLAEILGIQASGISHIMSGRNKPSFDFLLKLLQRFPQINPDWLLLDKGPMYRDEIKNKGGQSAALKGVAGTGGVSAAGGMGHGGASGGVNVPGGSGVAGGFYGSGGAGVVAGPGVAAGAGIMGGATTATGVGSSGGMGMVGAGAAGDLNALAGGSRELFGPDNNDIIPSGGQYGQGTYPSGQGAHPAGSRAGSGSGSGAQAQALPHASGYTGQSTTQPTAYQEGNFARSASVERIVVFYKDKTFSEYQPE